MEYGRSSGEQRKLITQYVLYGAVGIAIVLSCGVIPAVWDHFENARWRAQSLALQEKCLNYSLPADQAVYVESESAMSGPVWWTDYERTVVQPVMNRPMPQTPEDSVVLLHERAAPSGTSFLICVQHHFETPPHGLIMGIGRPPQFDQVSTAYRMGPNTYFITVIKPATATSTAMEIPQIPPTAPRQLANGQDGRGITRIYAGQIDPNNRSHFTIRYEVGKLSDILDAYVDNNGQVTLTQRNAPTSAPAGKLNYSNMQ